MMVVLFVFAVATACLHPRLTEGMLADHTTVTRVLDKMLHGYDKEVRPGIGGETVYVDTNMLIKSMGPISENDMSYSMQVYFRQRWRDDRLQFNMTNVTEFTLSNRFMHHIWKPPTYFLNGRRSKLHNITVPNQFVRIMANGNIYMSKRLTIHARCPMRLSRYPMDSAICPLYIGSFGYTTQEIVYRWLKNAPAVDVDPNVTMSQFAMGEIDVHNTTRSNRLGDFSILCVYIHLSRAVGFYMLETYVPCYLIVSLSWVSFWINRDAAPARVLLGVTTILSLAAVGMTVREGLPRVPYATALDVFQYMCLVYAMAALIEYAAVNYFTKLLPKEGGLDEDEEEVVEEECGPPLKVIVTDKNEREHETLLDDHFHVLDAEDPSAPPASPTSPGTACHRLFWRCLVGNFTYRLSRVLAADPEAGNSVSNIDIICRRLFPSTFIILNFFYWFIYLYFEPDNTDLDREKIITT
ncbi:gamma-aminobutyric acid receptor subunit alpha-6-like isoform X2 [Babylonia areolata]|uniref:gamma-aminobutyric acid receptor subunit alpha-6-like isoform X2 n=1 Tax=Babylonia areolata TaxID=304850 RepID=UPI003FD1B8EA